MLRVEAADDLSGVAHITVNGTCYPNLTGNAVDVTTVPWPSGVRGLAVCSVPVVTLAEPEGGVVVEGSVLDGVVVLVAGGFTGVVAAGGVTVGFWSWLGFHHAQ